MESEGVMTLEVREATLADLDEIMRIEEDWTPDQRASRGQMRARLEKFAEGFWLFARGGEIIGTLMSCPILYDPGNMSEMATWDEVTNDGYLPDIDLDKANALYLVSGSLRRDARGGMAYAVMMETPVALAERLGLDHIVTGAKIPGYDAYRRRFGEVDAKDYAFLEVNGCLADPFLEMYRGHGYVVPDRTHVIPGYYPTRPAGITAPSSSVPSLIPGPGAASCTDQSVATGPATASTSTSGLAEVASDLHPARGEPGGPVRSERSDGISSTALRSPRTMAPAAPRRPIRSSRPPR
jgi:hypothetical protein